MRPEPTLPFKRSHVSSVLAVALTSLVGFSVSGCALEPLDMPSASVDPVLNPLEYADPRVGSGGFGYANGSAFPGAAAPFGLAKVGPDTRGPYDTINFLHYSGYWAGDDIVRAFSHMHLHGTGATDYGVLGVMPIDSFDGTQTTDEKYQSPFQKSSEEASPGYYAVTLDNGNIRAELTATPHGAHHRYGYPAGTSEGHLVIDLDHHLSGGDITDAEFTLDPATNAIRGRLHNNGGMSTGFGGYDLYFDAVTRAPWKSASVWSNGDAPKVGTSASGKQVGLVLDFDLSGGAPIELQVGISFVSAEGALWNRQAELSTFDFEGTRAKTEASWADLLGRMKVWGGTDAERRMFYSSLYRCFLMPTVASDVNGQYRYWGTVHAAEGFSFQTDQSLWDTYRTLTPLYGLIAHDALKDTVRSLHAMAQIGGFFPKWPIATGEAGTMIGASADIVLADAYVKGMRDFDADGAYSILRSAALDVMDPPGGRGGRAHVVPYMELGYVPAEIGRSASHTLEYAHDDLGLANLAEALGKTDDAALFRARSLNHRNLFDLQTGFIRAKSAEGMFVEDPYNPYSISDHYAEANGWQSLWAEHDIPGIAELLGKDVFIEKLTRFFEESVTDLQERPIDDFFASGAPRNAYWHGNEPDIHAAYAFAQVGRPDLTQKYLHWAAITHYNDTPTGLPGNDDGGTMSAWYLFSAAGFYPIAGTDRYIIGAPFFPRLEIKLPSGNTLVVEAEGRSAEAIYVKSVTFNGAPITNFELRHGDIMNGGTLHFEMSKAP